MVVIDWKSRSNIVKFHDLRGSNKSSHKQPEHTLSSPLPAVEHMALYDIRKLLGYVGLVMYTTVSKQRIRQRDEKRAAVHGRCVKIEEVYNPKIIPFLAQRIPDEHTALKIADETVFNTFKQFPIESLPFNPERKYVGSQMQSHLHIICQGDEVEF